MNCLDKALAVFKIFPDSTKLYYNGDHVVAIVGDRTDSAYNAIDLPSLYMEIKDFHGFEAVMDRFDVQDAETLLKYYKHG